MGKNSEKLKPSFIFVACFLILFLSVGYYVFFYVPAKKVQLTERYMRLTAMMSYQFESIGYNIATVIESAVERRPDERNGERLAQYMKYERAAYRYKVEHLGPFARVTMRFHDESATTPIERRTICTELRYVPKDESLEFTIQEAAQDSSSEGCPLGYLRISLEEWIRYIPQSEEFEDVLILDPESGEVIYLKGQNAKKGMESSVLATNLGLLNYGTEEAPSVGGRRGAPAGQSEEHRDKGSICSHVIDCAFGQSSFKVFLQPLPLKFIKRQGTTSPTKSWYIGGLVGARTFDQRIRRIPVWLSLLFSVLIFLSLAAYPLLKIYLMGDKDRFRVRDILFLVVSLIVGIPLAAFSILSVSEYANERSERGATLRDLSALAGELHERFLREIALAYGQLNDFIATDQNENIITAQYKRLFRSLQGGRIPPVEKDYDREREKQVSSCRYPYFDLIFLADASGVQRYKLNNGKDIPLTFNNVSQREYFKRIVSRDYWYVTPQNRPMAMELVYSMSNGSYVLILSTPCEGKVVPGESAMKVAAISFRPLSVTRPVFPPHYGFAIIDSDGKVMFHSDQRLNSIENFFSECDDPLSVKGAVFAKAETRFPIKTVYQGRVRDLYVKHFNNIPWSIIVFKDRDIEGLFTLTKIIDAGSHYGYYVVLFAISFLLFVTLYNVEKAIAGASGRDLYQKFRCVWPDRDLRLNDLILSVMNALCLAFLLWDLYSQTRYYFLIPTVLLLLGYSVTMKSLYEKFKRSVSLDDWLTILIVPTGVLLFWLPLIRDTQQIAVALALYAALHVIYFLLEALLKKSRDKLARSWFGRNSHTLVIQTLVLLLFAYPALTCFRFHSREEGLTRLKYHQLVFSRDYAAWRDWFRENYDSKLVALKGESPADATQAVYSLPSQGMRIREYQEWNTRKTTDNMKGEAFEGLARPLISVEKRSLGSLIIEKTLPIDYEPLARILYLRRDDAASHPIFAWQLVRSPGSPRTFLELSYGDRASLYYSATRRDVERFFVVSVYQDSSIKTSTSFSSIVTVLLIVLFLGFVLFLLIRSSGKKIFLSDYESCEARVETESDLIAEWKPTPGKYLVLGRLGSRVLSNEENQEYQVWDAREIVAWEKILYRATDPHHGVIITSFDVDMYSASANLKKLEVLERLIFALDVDVTVFSQFEPLQYFNLTSPPPAATSKQNQGQDKKTPAGPDPNDGVLFNRWQRVLSRLTRKYLSASTAAESPSRGDSGLNSGSARADYDGIWFSSTREEKLVMIHLAQEGLINAKDRETVRRLLRRKLIKLFPTRLMNDDLKRYVRTAPDLESILKWERETLVSDWRNVSRPLLFLAIGTIVFLVVTQPGLLNSWLAVGAAVTTSIPMVLRAVDALLGNIIKKS